jgi:glycosyltransferase involved in cell wall biosynthesis
MKISILTVCFNSAATISDTIESIAIQSYPDIEHIVIDGASRDSTMDIVRSAKSVSKYISEPDNGIYDAMNKGIAMATGEIVGTLNSDDFYMHDKVIEKIAAVFNDPEVDACYADLIYVAHDDSDRIVRYWKSRPFRPGLFKVGWMPAHPTFFVRKRLYDELGTYDLNFRLQSDFELTMRYLELYRINCVYLPEIIVKMRIGGASNQSLRNIVKGNIEAYKACKKNHLGVSPLFNIFKVLSRVPQFFRRPAAT